MPLILVYASTPISCVPVFSLVFPACCSARSCAAHAHSFMKQGNAEWVPLCAAHTTRFLLWSSFITVSVLIVLRESVLATNGLSRDGALTFAKPRWLAALMLCFVQLFLALTSSLMALGIAPAGTFTARGRLSQSWLRVQAATPSWLTGGSGVLLCTSVFFLFLSLPVAGSSLVRGIWAGVGLFGWFFFESRCAWLLENTTDGRHRPLFGSGVFSAQAADRGRRLAAVVCGQVFAVVLVSVVLCVSVHQFGRVVVGAVVANTNTTAIPTRREGRELVALRSTSAVLGFLALACALVLVRLSRGGRPTQSRRRPDSPQSPLMGSTDAFRSFAAKSSQRPSMQCALLLTATLRFSEVLTGVGFMWFLLSCGARRVDGFALALLVFCASGLSPVCVWAVQTVDPRSLFTKLSVLILLTVRATLACGVFMAQFWFVGEATIDRATPLAASPSPSFPSVQPTHSRGTRTPLAAMACLLALDRAVVTALTLLLPRVWEDVVREDKVLFNRPSAMTAASARLAWAVSQPFQAAAVVLLAILVLITSQPSLNDGAHFADPSGYVRQVVSITIATTELGGASVLAILWGKTYNLTGKHLQFIELGAYEDKECEQPV